LERVDGDFERQGKGWACGGRSTRWDPVLAIHNEAFIEGVSDILLAGFKLICERSRAAYKSQM